MQQIATARIGRLGLFVVLIASGLALPRTAVSETVDTITVTNLDSTGDGSLYNAIASANASTDDSVIIKFDLGPSFTTGTIDLAAVTLGRSMSITGPTGGGLTVLGAGPVASDALFTIAAPANVQIGGFTITASNGTAIGNLGTLSLDHAVIANDGFTGISNSGTLSLSASSVANNALDGIDNSGTLTLSASSSLTGNSVDGVHNTSGGTVNASNTDFSNNFGNGLYSDDGTVSISNSTFTSNANDGIDSSAQLTLSNSTLSQNNADGLTSNAGTVQISTTTFSANSGNGISIFGGTATVTSSTADTNLGDGISIFNDAGLGLTNSTIAQNFGNGISNFGDGTAVILNGTIAQNGLYGIDNAGLGVVQISNALVAQNDQDLSGTFVSNGHNLVGDGTGVGLLPSDLVGTTMSPLDPKLDTTLQLNGGVTKTLKLLAGSPAIDAADPLVFPPTDQRGVARPQPAGGRADIGAYEFQGMALDSVAPLPAVLPSSVVLLSLLGLSRFFSSRRTDQRTA